MRNSFEEFAFGKFFRDCGLDLFFRKGLKKICVTWSRQLMDLSAA